MSRNTTPSPFVPFQVHVVSSTQKSKSSESPTSSILKTPTAIFVNSRSSSSKTRKLKFANGPVDLETLRFKREGSQDSASSASSSVGGDVKQNNGQIDADGNLVEVAISPVKRMKVSPESWTAFLEYKKYNDYANETEKTDYTYSRLSKYRHKEIIPGFPIRPNLSRSPINRSTSSSKSYNFSYASDSYIKSLIFNKAGLRHRARQLNLDSSEDETDVISTSNYQEWIHVRLFRTFTRSLVAIYTSILYYIALSTSTIKDSFSRFFSRRSSYTSKISSGTTAFWIPWSSEGKYASPVYLSGSSSSYYSSFRSALYRLYERLTTVIYVSSHSSIEYVKVKYSESSGRRKLLWFLIPFLLLAGLQLARSDSFPNPDAILNSAYKSVSSVPSYLHNFFIVSIPHFFIKTIPYFFTDVIPSFLTETIPSAFWTGFDYLKNISNHINFFGALPDLYNGFKYHVTSSAEIVFNFFVYYISAGYAHSYNFLVLFYSYFCTQSYDLISTGWNLISYLYNSVLNLIWAGWDSAFNFAAYLYSLLVFAVFYALDGGLYAYEIVSESVVNSGKWLYDSVVQTSDSVYSGVANIFNENEEVVEVNASIAKNKTG